VLLPSDSGQGVSLLDIVSVLLSLLDLSVRGFASPNLPNHGLSTRWRMRLHTYLSHQTGLVPVQLLGLGVLVVTLLVY
jgi:hypothetical protein